MSDETDRYIEDAADRFVEEWRECCRIPSVATDPVAVARAADWIEARLRPVFGDVRRIDIPDHGPLLAATIEGSGPGHLLLYTHYDVQPAGDEAAWTSPPFSAEVRDGAMFARGACDDKSDVTARIQAVEAWLSTLDGRPPYTLTFLSDPAEEIGSPGLGAALAENASWLRADACLWESFLLDDDGNPGIGFGCRGSLQVRLDLRLLRVDQHTAFGSIVRSAPLELMRLVSSLVDENGTVVVDGFHDDARTPSPEELAAADRVPLPVDAVSLPGVRGVVEGDEATLRRRLLFSPSMSVARMVVGEDGVGVVPAEASVSLRFSLVPDQDPQRIVACLRRHLDARGGEEVRLTLVRSIEPAGSPLDSPFADATISAAREVYGEPVVYPVMIGAGPGKLFLDHLGAPIISPAGTLRPDGNMHGPDEHGAVADYLRHVRFTARLLERLAEGGLREPTALPQP